MNSESATSQRWLLWSLATAMLALQNLEVLTVGALANDLGDSLHISASQVGGLFGMYTLFYALMQLPSGLAFSRFSATGLLIWACLLFAAGNILFAVSDNLVLAYAGRVIAGIGGGLFFIGYFALTTNQFDPLQFATLLGLNQLVKFLLAMAALALMPLFLSAGGDWREYFFAMGIIFLPFIPALWWVGRKLPQPERVKGDSLFQGIRDDLGKVCRIPQIRRALVMGFLGSGSIMAFTGLWYLPFAEAAGYSVHQADNLGSIMMLAMGIGMTVAGWISDKLRRRKPILVWGMIVTLFSTACLIGWIEPPFVIEAALVVLLALFGAAFLALLYVLVKESVPAELTSTALGVVNTAIFGGLAFMQWLPGALLDLVSGSAAGATPDSIGDYQLALLVYPPGIVIALVLALRCRETANQVS